MPRSASIGRRCRTIPIGPTTRSRSSARCWRRRRCTSRGPASSRRRTSRKRRSGPTARRWSSNPRTGRSRCGPPSSSGCCAIGSKPTSPRPEIEKLREQARRQSAEPILNPASRDPLSIRFTNAAIRDVLNFIGNATGINVTYDRDFQDRIDHAQPRGRDAGAGAAADHGRQSALLQGAERADDHRRRRHDPEAHPVRRAGDSHVLPVACRRDRDLAAAHRHRARRRRGHPADHRRQQDHATPSPSAPPARWCRSSSG